MTAGQESSPIDDRKSICCRGKFGERLLAEVGPEKIKQIPQGRRKKFASKLVVSDQPRGAIS
jgi:hypothetical protein